MMRIVLLMYASMLWTPSSPYYIYNTQIRQQGKLKFLQRELLLDAQMKCKAIQHYRDQYYKSLQYQLGDMVYEMRDFYKKMIRTYQNVDKNISYGHYDHNTNTRNFVLIHRMSMEIESKVTMIQKWQRKREHKKEYHERMQAPLRTGTNQEYDELQYVPLREVQVRERMARRTDASRHLRQPPQAARAPPRRVRPLAAAVDLGDKRRNKKWQHVRDDDFAPLTKI